MNMKIEMNQFQKHVWENSDYETSDASMKNIGYPTQFQLTKAQVFYTNLHGKKIKLTVTEKHEFDYRKNTSFLNIF